LACALFVLAVQIAENPLREDPSSGAKPSPSSATIQSAIADWIVAGHESQPLQTAAFVSGQLA